MTNQTNSSEYCRYFSPRQKVYLVNMSSDRNSEIYESLSGVVASSGMDLLEITISHAGQNADDIEAGRVMYKLTSEAFGSGIQVLADLTGIVSGTTYQFRLHGTLEMFQRRVASRVELSAPLFHLRRNFPFELFRKEWSRVIEHQETNGMLPGLVLLDTGFNLSAGGIGLVVDANQKSPPLSMFFASLDEKLPVCALAETVWEQRVDDILRCGFRFICILKEDQERISNCISEIIRKSGGSYQDFKRNWVLVDKMVSDLRKS